LRKLFPNHIKDKCKITVLDIDERFLKYIEGIAKDEGLPIECYKADLRQPLDSELIEQYDCFFTDPPYTMQGMELFLSRGISALKRESGLAIFFSFAHKTPDFNLNMQWAFLDMGLIISDIMPRFNKYEGAEIIGNTGQMIVLKTTNKTDAMIKDAFDEELYTGEIRRTIRIYQCKKCKSQIEVGQKRDFKTIEALKDSGCPSCKGYNFDLIDRVTSNE
jgi:predicted methyltransferase